MPREIHRGEIAAIRVSLGDEGFAALVRGDIAYLRGVAPDHLVDVEITLADISYARMFELVRAAMENRIA